jgi:uncharacterized ferredoxin-like protein
MTSRIGRATGEHADAIALGAVRQVANLMAAAAITAPKSGGQLFLAGKPAFLETVIVEDPATRAQLASWLRSRGTERREPIWFRDADADVAEAVDAILFIGLAPNWYPPNYDCGACGYATCAEFLHATKTLRTESAELEFTGPTCNLRDNRPRHRRRLGRQSRRDQLHRLPLPNPRRRRRPQTRHHHRRTRRRALALSHPQGDRLRPAHARSQLRHPRPTPDRHPAGRHPRRSPRRRRPRQARHPTTASRP